MIRLRRSRILMKSRGFLLVVVVLSAIGVMLAGCGGTATGTIRFYANGEDFVRQGFVSKDGWAISFDHVYVTLNEVTAYQTNPPYDAHTGPDIEATVSAGLDGAHTVDLAEGGEDASSIRVGEVQGAEVGLYNAISWEMVKVASGPAAGYSLVMVGMADKAGQSVDFTIRVEDEYVYSCGEYVGDERKGFVNEGETGDLEMTFHFDHIFGDMETPQDDELNLSALGFQPFAATAENGEVEANLADLGDLHLGHVGEGHCHCE